MQKEKRKGDQAIPDNLRELLTPAQVKTLDSIQLLGWQLKFVRRPLFQEPIPVVSNATNDQIGMLDPDGRINIDIEVEVRTDLEAIKEPEQAAVVRSSKKRYSGMPIPDNFRELLNDHQLLSLHQIENFGWQLLFVRRPDNQQPVVVIVSAMGDRFATLEADGRIEINSELKLRETSRLDAMDQ